MPLLRINERTMMLRTRINVERAAALQDLVDMTRTQPVGSRETLLNVTPLCGAFLRAATESRRTTSVTTEELRVIQHYHDRTGCLCWRLINAAGRGDAADVTACLECLEADARLGLNNTRSHVCGAGKSVTFAGLTLTPLVAAVRGGHAKVVEQLVAAQAPVVYSMCPVIAACETGDRDMLDLLYRILPRCRDPETRDHPQQRSAGPLATVAAGTLPDADACALLRYMVEEIGLNVDYVDTYRQTPVLAAISAGRTAVWRCLLRELGASLDVARTAAPRGVVLFALRHHRYRTAAALMTEFHARVAKCVAHDVIPTGNGHVVVPFTAFDAAIRASHRERFNAFLRAVAPRLGAEFTQQLLLRALHTHIVTRDRWGLVRTIVEDMGTPLHCTRSGCSPLVLVIAQHFRRRYTTHATQHEDALKMVRYLLAHGADPNMPLISRRTDADWTIIDRPFGAVLDVLSHGECPPEFQFKVGVLLFQYGADLSLPVLSTRLNAQRGWRSHDALSAAVNFNKTRAMHMVMMMMRPPPSASRWDELLRAAVEVARRTTRPSATSRGTLDALAHTGQLRDGIDGTDGTGTATDHMLATVLSQASVWSARSGLVCLRAQRAACSNATAVDEYYFALGVAVGHASR